MADEKNLTAVEDKEKAETAKTGKSDKDEKAKKKGPGLGTRINKYFRDSKGEFKKIIWPTKEELTRDTLSTLAMCAVIGIFVGLFDLGLSALVKLVLKL